MKAPTVSSDLLEELERPPPSTQGQGEVIVEGVKSVEAVRHDT